MALIGLKSPPYGLIHYKDNHFLIHYRKILDFYFWFYLLIFFVENFYIIFHVWRDKEFHIP